MAVHVKRIKSRIIARGRTTVTKTFSQFKCIILKL
jgi:hypothetical protein